MYIYPYIARVGEGLTPTFDEPFTGGTPSGANAEVTDPERFRIGVAQERFRLAFLAHREDAVVPPASFVKQLKE